MVIEHVINEKSPAAIAQVINKYDSIDTYLNLSGGSKLMGLLTFRAAQGSKAILIYIDNDNGKILVLNEQLQDPICS